MEFKPDDLRGMSAGAAKEYIFHHIAALKLAEKKHGEVLAELDKWEKRRELALNRGAPDLAEEAEKEAGLVRGQAENLAAEITEFKVQIEKMRKEIPALAARERSVDPDLLEQELLMVLGKDWPSSEAAGDKTRPETDQDFKTIEADAALEALKTRMGLSPERPPASGSATGSDGGLHPAPEEAP
jgi:phage shock protein A